MSECIRRASEEDREAMMSLIDTAFGINVTGLVSHLLTPSRLANHLLHEREGSLAGVLGLYPHEYRQRDVTFRVAGIGQVATDAKQRGSGVMSQLLRATSVEMEGADFSWLFGDRRRYARYGWAQGGRQYIFIIDASYLPTPPPIASVIALDVCEMAPRILRALASKTQTLGFPAEEIALICQGMPAKEWRAWALNEAWILCDEQGARVFLADGDSETLAKLLAHAARALPGERRQLTVLCETELTSLQQACLTNYCHVSLQHAANFRVENLLSFLQKACQIAQPHVTHGDEQLSLLNVDNGQTATLCCERGRLSVIPTISANALRLTTEQLSEICLGFFPLEAQLPSISPASPFRRVLPLPVHINRLFAL